MQQTISYKSWPQIHTINRSPATRAPLEGGEEIVKGSVEEAVKDNAVIVFGRSGCCMSHVVKRLLLGLGVNPTVYEVEEAEEAQMVVELQGINSSGGEGNRGLQFPSVFIGGRLFGGLDRVMATHITGELVPILKEAGALWL